MTAGTQVKPATPGPAQGNRRRARNHGDRFDTVAWIFLSPWLLGLCTLTLVPMLASLYLSLTDYDLFTAPSWIGFDNYRKLFTDDPRYIKSVFVTLTYVVIDVPLKLVIALAVALLLRKFRRGVGVYRALFYLPSVLGNSVAIALLWRQIFGADGLANSILSGFGLQTHSWIDDPDTALYIVILLSLWQFGTPMVIFLAGLSQIPVEMYEAASIDGAGKLRQLVRITIPLLSPIILFNFILQMIQAFQSFTSATILSGGRGGPVDSTLLYTLYLYQKGFTDFKMGYASAMAWILLAAIAVLTTLSFKIAKRHVYYAGDNG